jgi:hypothetical protein
MDYEIVIFQTPAELEKGIKWRLINGWKLAGGVSVCITPLGNNNYHQAMYRTEDKECKN